MKIEKTQRGFAIGSFTDRNNNRCSIQKSSLATEDAIWFGVNDANPVMFAEPTPNGGVESEYKVWVKYPIPESVSLSTRMHLTQDQVKLILPSLQHFAETGELP